MSIMNSRAIFLPYIVHKLEDGRHVVLNRNHKPLGYMTDEYIRYEELPITVRFKGLTPAKIAKLSCRGDTNDADTMLYDDGCTPTHSAAFMKAYLARLGVLANLQFKED